MKKLTIYTLALLLVPTLFMAGCKKDLSLKRTASLTDSTHIDSTHTDSTVRHGTVSTVITGLYNYITADNAGNIYALRTNYGADTIYKIDSLGNKSMFYTPPVTMDHDTAVINTMACLTIDSTGNVYTINYNGIMIPSVLKITPSGSGTIIFSSITPGGGSQIEKIAVNQGNFYFSNSQGTHKITTGGASTLILNRTSIFTVSRDGVIYYPAMNGSGQVNLAELGANGSQYTFTKLKLNSVIDITAGPRGVLFTSETTNDSKSMIREVNVADTHITTVVSSVFGHVDGPFATAKIGVAFDLAVGSNNVYFSEITGNPNDIRKLTF